MLPLDLHVLGLPLAFILSQDQTLHRCFVNIRPNETKSIPAPTLDSIYPNMHKAYYMVCFLIRVPLEQALTRSRFL